MKSILLIMTLLNASSPCSAFVVSTEKASMPQLEHKLIIGPSGTGKTNLIKVQAIQIARQRTHWATFAFPHPQAGEELIGELLACFGPAIQERLIVERVSDVDRVIHRRYVNRSFAQNEFDFMRENDEFCWQFLEMAARRRGLTDLAETPVLEKYAKLAISVYQSLDEWISESLIPQFLRPKSDAQQFAIDHCTLGPDAEELRRELVLISRFSVQQQITLLEPAERLLNALLRNVAIYVRTTKPQTVDFVEFKNRCGLHIILGGNISDDALRLHVGTDFQQTAFAARNRQLREGYYYVDEALNYHLLSNFESKALSTLRAFGMHCVYAIQSTDFESPEIATNVLTNTQHFIFQQAWKSSEEMAKTLLPLLNKYDVHHTTQRQVHAGFQEIERRGKSVSKGEHGTTESESVSSHLVPIYDERDEPTYTPPRDQLVWLAQELQQLPVGTCIVNPRNSAPYKYAVPLMPDSWAFPGLCQIKAQECINLIKSQAIYEAPVHVSPITRSAERGTKKSWRSSGSSDAQRSHNSSRSGSSNRKSGHAEG